MDATVMGQRIRAMRMARGLRQSDLGKAVGVTAQAISLFESGTRVPRFDIGIKICEKLQISTDYLLDRTNNPEIGNSYTPVAITTARLAMVRAVNLLDDMLCDKGKT